MTTSLMWRVFLVASLAFGCSTPRLCPVVGEGEVGECVPYTPSTISGSESGSGARQLEVNVGDVGGGLVEVTLSATAATEVNVRLQGRPEDETHFGTSVRVDDMVTERRFVFRAQGQRRYLLDVKPVGTPSAGATWSVQWRYQPNVDCFEPNDTLATAKRIALDTPIEAYAHAGIIEGDGVLVGPGLLDFYRFELTEPTSVRLVVTRPSDTALAFEFWNAETDASWLVGTDLFAAAGVESSSDDLELPAGTHHVRVSTFASQASTSPLGAFPADWNQPYRLMVRRSKLPATAAGDVALTCAAPVTPPANDDECVRYTPASVSGAESFSLAASGDQRVVTMAPITDPGGGLLRVTLRGTHAAEIIARRVGSQQEQFGVSVLVGDAVDSRAFLLRAQGGERYELVVTLLGDPQGQAVSHTVTWAYEPNVDCYEHNDTPASARRIPLDRPITAFAHGGVVADDGLLVGPSFADFYRFVLTAPRKVTLAVRKPSDTAYTFELWSEADGVLAAVDHLASGGVEATSPEVELGVGVHLVRVGTFVSQPSTLQTTDPLPADWNQPYTLTVKTR